MRFITLTVTDEDRGKIQKRREGEDQYKNGLFGQVELMRKLLEVSPNVKKMEDVTQLLRIGRKIEAVESEKNPVLELHEDEYNWVLKVLSHDQYASYGAQFMRTFGELLEAIQEAKTEDQRKLHAVKEEL